MDVVIGRFRLDQLVVKSHARPQALMLSFSVAAAARGGCAVQLSRQQFRFLSCACIGVSRLVDDAVIAEALWGDRPDGGPLGDAISVYAHAVRKKLARLGVVIEREWGVGFRMRARGPAQHAANQRPKVSRERSECFAPPALDAVQDRRDRAGSLV